ncbi:MAG: hypothetical protein ABEJ76_05435 [Halanaeroarchaeum sp.]
MTDLRQSQADEVLQRRYEYEDETVLVADLGSVAENATVDVVDGTAVVVIEGPEGPSQYEFQVPEGSAHTFINNGVLTVEVSER